MIRIGNLFESERIPWIIAVQLGAALCLCDINESRDLAPATREGTLQGVRCSVWINETAEGRFVELNYVLNCFASYAKQVAGRLRVAESELNRLGGGNVADILCEVLN